MNKEWTILIYANGNNEFEPEMYKLLLDSRKIKSNNNLNVLVQIGREKKQLVKMLRPGNIFAENNDNWFGVRRYLIDMYKKNHSETSLIKDLGNLNMAHPKNLYDFLEWGMVTYPSEKYLLMMGGHSFQYLGIMTDYSQNVPYIMGIPEMAKALNLIKKKIGRNLDILVLDTCFMNMAEILYELAREKKHSVKNILTYIEYGPIGGLPVDKLINVILEKPGSNDVKSILTKIIDDLDFDLVAFCLNQRRLERIKRLTNDIGKILINQQNKSLQFVDISEQDKSSLQEVNDLKKSLEELVIHSKRVTNHKSQLVDIAHKGTGNKLAAYYTRLSFAKSNYWSKLLGVELLKEGMTLEENIQLKPLVLPLQALASLIGVMNQGANEQEIQIILRNLLEYKKWHKFSNVKVK